MKTHDIECLLHGEMVEVKRDLKANRTGNMCFERALFSANIAQTIVYDIGTYCVVFNRSDLWQRLKELSEQSRTKFVRGGDRAANLLLLAKVEDILKIGIVIRLEG